MSLAGENPALCGGTVGATQVRSTSDWPASDKDAVAYAGKLAGLMALKYPLNMYFADAWQCADVAMMKQKAGVGRNSDAAMTGDVKAVYMR